MKRSILLFGFVLLASTAVAQSSNPAIHPKDARPLSGLDRSKLPPVEKFETIRDRAVPGGALRGAQYVGRAEIVSMPVRSKGEAEVGSRSGMDRSLWRIMRAPNGTVNWMWRLGGNTSNTSATTQSMTSIGKSLDELSSILKIAQPSKEFVVRRDEVDVQGLRHVHLDQFVNGIPVWKREIAVHFDAKGQIETINGTYEPTSNPAVREVAITSSQAIGSTIASLKQSGQWANDDSTTLSHFGISKSQASLAYYPMNGGLRLVYDVDVHPNLLQHYTYLIDATTGEIVHRIADHCSLVAEKGRVVAPTVTGMESIPAYSGKGAHALSGFSASNAQDLNGATQNFRTYQHSDNTYYMLWDLSNFDAGKSTLPDNMSGGCMTIDLRNTDASQSAKLFHVTSSNNTWNDKAAVSAHTNMSVCFEYYKNTFGRKAIDGADATIVSVIHVTENGDGMENAYWNGTMMLYGDGKNVFKPLAGGLDVAAHEMTHGVTGHSAGLVYEGQSGALNESFSDVFGILVDSRNYLVGEDVMKPGQGTCLRNMENPGDPNAGSQQPGAMSEFRNLPSDQDNGGVHVNSGIPNHAAVLIMKALGREKTQRIYYTALTKYLTRSSQLIDCRLACEAAADEIFGKGSSETQAVSSSFAAVGIGGAPSDPGSNDVPPQTGGTDYIAFMLENGSIGALQPGTGDAVMFDNSAAVARVNTTNAGIDRCQLSAPTSGKDIWFVSQSGLLSFVVSTTGEVMNFPNLQIEQSGDIWNASVSPDESYVALASSYAEDPNIYIYDGTTLSRIELTPETQDGGAQQTIQYPDVMNWSPNRKQPRIGFDAYNENTYGGYTYSYWSMYEINFATQKIYNLVPAQSEDISIGNVAYSKLNPDLIAFNMIDQTSSDVILASFENNAFLPLGTSGITINGTSILDADRPTFSPDDSKLAFTSASHNAIVFYDGNQFQYLAYQNPLYNPYWMLLGGTEAVAVNPKATITGVQASPSIVSDKTTISFDATINEAYQIHLIDVLGNAVRTVDAGFHDKGQVKVEVDLHGLAAGAYLVRVSNGQSEAFGKLVVQ